MILKVLSEGKAIDPLHKNLFRDVLGPDSIGACLYRLLEEFQPVSSLLGIYAAREMWTSFPVHRSRPKLWEDGNGIRRQVRK